MASVQTTWAGKGNSGKPGNGNGQRYIDSIRKVSSPAKHYRKTLTEMLRKGLQINMVLELR